MTIILKPGPSGRNHISLIEPDSPMTACTDRTQLTREVGELPDWAYICNYDPMTKEPIFFVWTCKACEYPIDKVSELIRYPIRCSSCNKQFMSWKRTRTWASKFKDWFDQDVHKYVKLLTLTVDDFRIVEEITPELISAARSKLTSSFKKMRRTAAWKKYVDGGLWFFEWTEETIVSGEQMNLKNEVHRTDEIKSFNPHLHVILLSKYFPQGEIKTMSQHYGLGEIVDIRADKEKTAEDSLAYISHYSKKQYQEEGRNRNAFGCLTRRKKNGYTK